MKIIEAEFIYNFLSEKKFTKTLEVGLAYARSASHIIAATNSIHIAIDPFQSDYNNAGIENIKKLGFQDYLDLRTDFSHNVLPELLKENRKFEFIFIDGDHKFDGEFIDFYYSDLLIEDDGYILLHDTWMRSTRLVMSFIKNNKHGYQYIKTPLRNFALFKKIAEDKRDGMYFREFYTFKSMITHNINILFWNNKDNFFVKLLVKIKKLLK